LDHHLPRTAVDLDIGEHMFIDAVHVVRRSGCTEKQAISPFSVEWPGPRGEQLSSAPRGLGRRLSVARSQ
jgi:hypothetical protein